MRVFYEQFGKKAKTKISGYFLKISTEHPSCILNIGKGVIKYSEKKLHALVTPKWFNASWWDVSNTEVVTHHGSSFPFLGLYNQHNTPKRSITNIHFVALIQWNLTSIFFKHVD